MGYIKALSIGKNSRQTVYLVSDLSQQVAGYSGAKLYSALKYATKKKDVKRITRGIYAFSNDYSRIEFANKFRTPSYISLYTVLQEVGIIFQPYSDIYAVSQRSEIYEVDGQKYIYRKIKDDILLNHIGTIFVDGVHKATPERALCDTLYLDGDAFFDNLRDIHWELMRNLNTDVYGNNTVIAGFINKYTIV
ncbi:MAG: hypothetical protein Q8L37_00520 [Candidatus Gottesmanbacteria bacterium]|nr:hypothetical protein [Candidatus Gottesmanbacteria bacterium]